jgi:dihydroorotase
MELVVEGRAYVKGRMSNWCIGIEDGRIAAVAKNLKGEERIDCRHMMVLPAAIDPHVHFRDPGLTHKEDFSTGTLAAAFGGVGCVLDMPNTVPPSTGLRDLMEKKEAIAKKAWIDHGLFAGCVPGGKLEAMAPHVVGFKLFLGSSTGKLLVTEDRDLSKIGAAVERTGKVLSVHAEEDALIGREAERDLQDHLRNRPSRAEVAAIGRLAGLKCRVNVCHLSSAEGLQAAVATPFTMEVAAHHLLLDRSDQHGALAKVNPPLRTREDRAALLQAFIAGRIDMLGSDHAPHTIEEKSQEFDVAPSGMPGVETQVPIMLAMVKKGMVPLEVLVSSMSERPAEVFSLNKGRIQEGRDADLMIVDTRALSSVKVNRLHSKCGWTLYEGHDAIFPHATMVRGHMVVEDGGVAGERVGRDVVADRP